MIRYFWELNIAASALALILLVILLFRKSYPTLPRKTLKLVVFFNLITSILEIFTAFVFYNKTSLSFIVSESIITLYYCVLTTLHYLFLLFCVSSIRGSYGNLAEKILFSLIFCSVILFVLSNPWHHLVFDLNSPNYFGKAASIISLYSVFSIAYAFIFLIVNNKKITKLELSLNIFFLLTWFLSVVSEYVFGTLINLKHFDGIFVENFVVALTFAMIIILNDNPYQYFYNNTTVYNEATFHKVYSEKFKNKTPFKLITFTYEDFDLYIQKVGKVRAAVAIEKTLEFCRKQFGQNNVFGLGRYVIVIDARVFKDIEKECDKIAENCYKTGLTYNPLCKLIAKFVYFECPGDCANMSDLHTAIYMMHFYDNLSDDTITFFDKKLLDVRHRREDIITRLHEAIDNDGFEIFYQPLFDWKKNKHIGLEALIRFKDDGREFISPAEFIPIAEEEGLIFTIDEIVFEKVCRFIRNTNLKNYGIKFVDVNLSLLKLLDSSTVERYAELASRYEIDPSFINLEITETAEGDEKYLNTVRQNIALFREKGFSFSLDDYGSGYSTVIYMAEMDTKIVKIDASILWNAMKNKKYYTVLENCVRLIYCFDKECVCEGVESEEMISILKKLGVDYFQGYYYSKPVNESEILKILEKQNGVGISKSMINKKTL